MSWAKLDDGLYMHPKVLAAGLEAMGLWVVCLSYAVGHLTDGMIPESVVYALVSRRSSLPKRLVLAGLWERQASGDGWLIHDYLTYNYSKARILELRDTRAKAGTGGAHKRWGNVGKRDGKTHSNLNGKPDGNDA